MMELRDVDTEEEKDEPSSEFVVTLNQRIVASWSKLRRYT
jgi:hypothetical protein